MIGMSMKDAILALTKIRKQSIGLSALQLHRKMKKILKPSKLAKKAMKKLGVA